MNKKIKFIIASSLALLGSIFPQKISQAQTEEKIIRKEEITVAVREDTFWFGSREDGKRTGYCVDLAYALAERLSATGNTLDPIRVRFVTSTVQSRWDLVTSGTVDLECGPNGISAEREEKYGVYFSSPIFISATQILAERGTQEEDIKAGNGIIGAVKNTTTVGDLEKLFSEQQVEDKFLNTEQGVDALIDGEINGFSNDGTILLGAALERNLDMENDYTFIMVDREKGLSLDWENDWKSARPFCSGYGLILPGGKDNLSWQRYVNDFLANDKKAQRVQFKWLLDGISENSNKLWQACTGEFKE